MECWTRITLVGWEMQIIAKSEDEKRNIIDDSNVLTILTNSTNTTFFRIKHRISRVKDPGSNDNNVLTIITVITTIMF